MSQRSKKIKLDWVNCKLCCVTFSTKDTSVHAEICNETKKFQPQKISKLMNLKHGFSTSDFLVAKVVQKELDAKLFPMQLQNRVVLLNTLTMKLMGFCISHPIILQENLICKAWPDDSVHPMNIGVSKSLLHMLSAGCGDAVLVYRFTDIRINAAEITFIPSDASEFVATAQFKMFAAKRLDDWFVACGNCFSLSYCGKPCTLTVSQVLGEDASVSEKLIDSEFSSNTANVTDCLQNLDLNQRDTHNDWQVLLHRKSTQFFHVTSRTKFVFENLKQICSRNSETDCQVQFGGYSEQLKQLKEMLDYIFNKSIDQEEFKGLFIEPCRGALLYGPSGCGKSVLCKMLTNLYRVHIVQVNGSDIWSKFHGESESNLMYKFKEATEHAPCIIVLDDVDCLCANRDTSQSDVEKRVTSTLLTLMDELVSSRKDVFVLAATSKRDKIDSALRRPGRLDREIELPVPSSRDRFQILQTVLSSSDTSVDISDKQLKEIADAAHGFVGADLCVLCREAFMHCVRQAKGHNVLETKLTVRKSDLDYGLSVVQPSAMREVALEVPQVRWSDIGGQHDMKYKLKQAIEWPLKHPEAFRRLGITPPKGLLMYGPPGCSKTMIAKALARESGINFIAIKGPELFSKWVGESERAVRELFRKARSAAPSIVFFDEIDALAGERGGHGGGGGDVSDRVLAQLLTEIDGVEALSDVTVIAATNRPDRIDKALLRPGRLDRIVYVPLPDTDTRQDIFRIMFRKMPIADDVQLDELVKKTERYSGAEVAAVCKEAALNAMQEDINITCTHSRHFDKALETVTPRITDSLVDFYTSFAQRSTLHNI